MYLTPYPFTLTEVQDLLGHTPVKMTERYVHLAPENLRAAVALLDGKWSRNESRFSHGEKMSNEIAFVRR